MKKNYSAVPDARDAMSGAGEIKNKIRNWKLEIEFINTGAKHNIIAPPDKGAGGF